MDNGRTIGVKLVNKKTSSLMHYCNGLIDNWASLLMQTG